jgi:hypothetical protein
LIRTALHHEFQCATRQDILSRVKPAPFGSWPEADGSDALQ